MHRISLTLFATATLTALAAAQGPYIGFTARIGGTSSITEQVVCDPPNTVCGNALPSPTLEWAGGAAHDPMRNAVWHSEGGRIFELGLDLLGCTPGCVVPATLALGRASAVSGLTINPARNELYELETIPGFAAITTWRFPAGGAGCPRRVSTCRVQLPSARHLAGAIAFDQKRDLFYVATSLFNTGTPTNIALLIRRASSCQVFCRVPIDRCQTGALSSIRAMAYDECRDQLVVSDGRQTSVQAVAWTPSSSCPVLRPLTCCPLSHPQGEFWRGMDIRSITARKLGGSCLPSSCRPCPAMTFEAVGAAVPGNGQFGFAFDQAPTGGTGFAFVNVGGCVPVPLLCGTFFPQINGSLVALGPVALGGAGGCSGSGKAALPLPNDFSLCNLLLCAQGVVVCPTGGIGLTNALVVPVGA